MMMIAVPTESLRWHYSDQVHGSATDGRPLSPSARAPRYVEPPTYTVEPLYRLGVKTRTLLILAAITGLAIIVAFTLLVLSFPN